MTAMDEAEEISSSPLLQIFLALPNSRAVTNRKLRRKPVIIDGKHLLGRLNTPRMGKSPDGDSLYG